MKKTIKFISTESQTKEDWQIIRKIITNSSKIKFLMVNNKTILTVNVSLNNFNRFKNFINYIFFAIQNINNKSDFCLNNKIDKKSF